MITHKAQIMLYKRLLDDIQTKKYTIESFKKAYRPSTLRITPEFERQLSALQVSRELQSVDAIADKFFSNLAMMGKISNTLSIRYINQATGKVIKVHKIEYDDKEMSSMLDFILKFWKGERESLPVPEEEKWKCNYCAFFGKECKVWWPQKTL
jgi:exonuclease V